MEAQLNHTVCKTKIDKVAGMMQYHDLSSKVYSIVHGRYTYPQTVKCVDDTRQCECAVVKRVQCLHQGAG